MPAFKLFMNSNILVIGSSGTGKTSTVMRIIKEKMIGPIMPKKIFYMYGAWQKMFDEWRQDKTLPEITFIAGINWDLVEKQKGAKLLIVDDLILELDKKMTSHFLFGSSHHQTTTIFLTHSIYMNNDLYRLIFSNSNYLLIAKMKNKLSSVQRLSKSVLGSNHARLMEGYSYIKAYQFILLSFHPKVPEELLVTCDIFSRCPSVFIS